MAEKVHAYNIVVQLTRTEMETCLAMINEEPLLLKHKISKKSLKKKLERTYDEYKSRKPNSRRYTT
jgi:hypothetical protein